MGHQHCHMVIEDLVEEDQPAHMSVLERGVGAVSVGGP